MNNQRAKFAISQFDNLVYVYGGIQGQGKGKNKHVPQLVDQAIIFH